MKWVVPLALLLLPLAARAQAPSGQFPPEQVAPGAAEPAPTSSPAPAASVAAPSVPPQTAVPAVPLQPTAAAVPAPPAASPAPPAAPPPAPRAPANWNIGAGLLVGGADALVLLGGTSRLSYQAAFERRLGGTTWLALSGRFSYNSWEVPLQSSSVEPGDPLEASLNRTTLALLLGLRHAFVQKVVEVSVFSAIFAGYDEVGGDAPLGESVSGFQQPGNTERGLGLLAGVAVERELIEALALRLSIDMAGASVSRRQSLDRDGDDGTVTETDLGEQVFSLAVRPGLQIHFYF